MRIVFLVAGELLEVFVDEERGVSMRGSLTNDAKVSYDDLARLSGQDGKREFSLAKAIIRDLRDEQDLADYLRLEFMREPALAAAGIEYVKTEL